MKNLLILLLLVGCFGCATGIPVPTVVSDPYIPVFPKQATSSVRPTGSIFADEHGSRLFGHKQSFAVGDVITVILTESTQAQRRSGLEAVKEGTNIPLKGLKNIIGAPLNSYPQGYSWLKRQSQDAFLATDFDDLTVETKGRGTANQAASLNGAIAVLVTQVLPNGNLVIQGQKRLSLSEGSETVRLSGIVSASDIQPDNTVLSSRIAGAQIAYQGTGELAEFAKVNWGTRFFNTVWPF
jgi:flagellar L-ring protein precursor FlgH